MLSINLRPGAYWLGYDSATGKSRMKQLMDIENSIEPKFLYVTYDPNMDICHYIESNMNKYSIVFIDRLDLYCTDRIINLINNLCKEKIVLIDIKNRYILNRIACKDCSIKLTRDGVIIDELKDYLRR